MEDTFHLYEVVEKPQIMRKTSNSAFTMSQALSTCLAMRTFT